MAAEVGNKYAEKWTEETVMPILDKIVKELPKKKYVYIGEALSDNKLHKDIWADWKRKFAENEKVYRTIKNIEQILENTLYVGALKGNYNSAVAIFSLKNNHNWVDKRDFTSGGDKLPEYQPIYKIYNNAPPLAGSEEEIEE